MASKVKPTALDRIKEVVKMAQGHGPLGRFILESALLEFCRTPNATILIDGKYPHATPGAEAEKARWKKLQDGADEIMDGKEPATFEGARSRCSCGHAGDKAMQDESGVPTDHDGLIGHGGCKRIGCKCNKFTWTNFLPEFQAHLDAKNKT